MHMFYCNSVLAVPGLPVLSTVSPRDSGARLQLLPRAAVRRPPRRRERPRRSDMCSAARVSPNVRVRDPHPIAVTAVRVGKRPRTMDTQS